MPTGLVYTPNNSIAIQGQVLQPSWLLLLLLLLLLPLAWGWRGWLPLLPGWGWPHLRQRSSLWHISMR